MLQEAQGFPQIAELAAAFGGGIGREQDVCGAIVAAAIAIGYRSSRTLTSQKEIADNARPLVRAIYEGFRHRFGAVDCRQLTGHDFNEPGGYQRFLESTVRKDICHPCIEYAVRAVLNLGE